MTDEKNARKGTWHEGDIELLKEGTGEPLISEAELERILRENREAEEAEKKERDRG